MLLTSTIKRFTAIFLTHFIVSIYFVLVNDIYLLLFIYYVFSSIINVSKEIVGWELFYDIRNLDWIELLLILGLANYNLQRNPGFYEFILLHW